MKHEDIKQLNYDLSDLLSDRQVNEALTEIIEGSRKAGFHALARRGVRLQADYGYMLDYFARGADDPARQEMYDHLYDECWTLLDTLVDSLERETSEATYYTALRRIERSGQTVPQLVQQFLIANRDVLLADSDDTRLAQARRLDELAETLWLAIWTNYPATDADRQAIDTLLCCDEVPYWHRASFLSAQTIALLTFFDAAKALGLATLMADSRHPDLRMRALVGFVMVGLKYTYRIDHLPALREALQETAKAAPGETPAGEASSDSPSPLLLQIQLQILQAPEADTATRKMHDELAPELRKGLSELQRRRNEQKKRRTQQTEDVDMELNPEWAEALNTDRLKAKIADFARMQAEGTDVMMDGFMAMSRQPFFTALHHWFVPFDMDEPWVLEQTHATPELKEFLQTMLSMQNLCHTDRQTYFLGFAHTPEALRRQVLSQMQEKGISPDLLQRFHATGDGTPPLQPADITRHYLHDLYRFYRIAPHHDEWESPFDDRELLDFASSPYLSSVTSSPEATQLVARYLFDKQRWPEAVAALQRWLDLDTAEEALQKLAYAACQKEVDDLVLAHEALVTCNALYPDKEWTLRYLAQFYIRSEEFASAELLLEHACEIFPDDTDFLNKRASVLIAQNRFKEAFEPLCKADLLKEGQPRTLRNLAWCNFMLRRGDKAEQYIRLLLDRKPTRTDWLNAGHIALQGGNLPLAIERYRHCFDRGRWKLKDFEEAVYKDWSSLLDAGVRDVDISLTLDVFRRAATADHKE